MPSFNSRTSTFPKNGILMITNTSNVPTGYTQECTLNGKYIKGTSTVCTNPGVSFGNANHSHSSAGCHTHTGGSCSSHSHTGSTSTAPYCIVYSSARNARGVGVHAHTFTSGASCSAACVVSSGSHSHDTIANDLSHRTVSYYKKTETSIGLRRKSLPTNTMIFYDDSSIVSGYTPDTAFNCKHIKGVVSSPGVNSGSSAHVHSSESHTHSISATSHSHSVGTLSTVCYYMLGHLSTYNFVSGQDHNHATGSLSISCVTGGGTSTSSGGHTHGSLNYDPSYNTLTLVTNSSVKMRRPSIEKNTVFLWKCSVADIPSNYGVLTSMLCKYPKISGTPNTTGGSNTHTHACPSASHTHSGCATHSHTGSGTTGSISNGASSNTRTISGCNATLLSHSHSMGSIADSGGAITTGSDGFTHTHGSGSSEPEGITVAFIKRV
jgi:hypothetical protein